MALLLSIIRRVLYYCGTPRRSRTEQLELELPISPRRKRRRQ